MKKLKLFLSLLMLIAFSVGNVWAEDPVASSTMSAIATANSWVTASGNGTQTCYTSFNLDANISISTTGSANCGSFWGEDWRLYQAQSGNVTVTALNGCTLKDVTFTYGNKNNGVLKDGTTKINTGSKTSLSGTSKTFTVGNTGSATNGQVKITAISVTYIASTPSYTINAESNNTTYGTVSLTGSVITATRNPGYRYATPAYTVTSGTATVAQSGDAFTVTPSTDCTVRINFEPIPTHNIIFNNGGVKVIANAVVAEGASYDITEAVEDALIASCTYKKFEGWTLSSSIADPSAKPALVSSVTMEDDDVNLYAVYSVTSGSGSSITEETASVTMLAYATAHSWGDATQYATVEMNADITATAAGGGNTGKYYENGNEWRFYGSESATITIAAADGCTLKSITPTFTTKSSGVLKDGETTLTSGTPYEISGTSKTLFIKVGQVKFTAISVTYDKTTSGTTTFSLDAECAAPGQCVAPTFNHGTGTYNVAQSIELATTTEEADIYYTLDGTTPSKTNGTKYMAAFSVSENKTVKAIAVKDGNDDSNVAEAVLTFKPVTPAITKDVRHFMSTALVTIACETAGAAIHYTVDGSDPLASSPTYSAPFEISATTTVKVIAVKTNWNNSDIASETFTKATVLSVADARDAIDETPAGINNQYVEGTIYQIDGYNSTYHSITYWISDDGTSTNGLEVYSGKGLNGADFAAQTDLSIGDVVIVSGTLKKYNSTYEFDKNNEIAQITKNIAVPTFSPEGAGFLTTLTVSLATTEVGGEIRYTVDGSDPTKSSALYSEPIELSETTTIKAATFKGEDASAIITKTYTKATKITVTDALAALESENHIENQCVYGVVSTASTSLYSGKLTYFISVDGEATNQLKVYNGKGLNGANFTNKSDLQVGDLVTVFGTLMIYNEEKEFDAGNYLLEFKRLVDPELEWSAASFDAYIGQSNTFPTLTNDHSVTVKYSSSNTTAATIDENTGVIALGTTPNVSTTITATFEGDDDYKADAVSYTLNVYKVATPGTITYEENGGSIVTDVTTPVDNFPDPLPEPTKENYIFAGWWTTSTFNDGTQAVAGAPMDGNVILYAKWTEIPVWAYTYTSNVTLSGAKVKFYGESTEYDAVKAGTGSVAGSTSITVPAQATKLHFHAYSWYNETVELTVTAPTGVTVTPSEAIAINKNSGISGSSSTYTLAEGSDPKTDAYYAVSLSGNTEPVALTISATSGKRFVLFGVNQEGGIVPELDHITITGELTNKDYELGDELDKTGLTVTAYYTLAGAAHHNEDVTSDVVWSNDPLTGGQTSVDVTATYGGKSDTKACAINAVVVPTPEIILSESALEFSGKQYGAVANKTFNVTLKNVAAATVALSGDDAAKFSIDPAALTANGTVTVSVANTNVAGSFSATITVSDDVHAATSQTVALTLTITADEAQASTTAEWIEATEIYDGMPVLITGVNTTTSKIYAMGAQNDNNRAAVEATLNGDVLKPGNGTKAFTLVKQDDDTYAIMTSDGKYLYAASSSKNYLRTQTYVDADAKWTLSVTSASAESSSNRHIMQFNTSSVIFSCYESASQAPIKLYTPKTYTRTVSGNYGTICLPNGGKMLNGALYEIAEMDYLNDKPNKIYFDEVEGGVMVAGKPYIFKPNDGETTLRVVYMDAENAPAGNYKGLYGKYTKTPLAKDDGNYILKNNQYYYVNSDNVYCEANRAYIKLAEVPEYDSSKPSYSRRRIALNVNNEQVATGMENVQGDNVQCTKVLINGQFFIIRGEKMFDATGRLVK